MKKIITVVMSFSLALGLYAQDEASSDQKKMFKDAFKFKLNTLRRADFSTENFLSDLNKVLEDISQKYNLDNIPDKHLPELIENIKIFLLSNNISSLKKLKKSENFLKYEIADRFFTAKTTAFFRDWREIKFLKKWLMDLD